MKKYQNEFDAANLSTKIAIFEKIKNDYLEKRDVDRKDELLFMQKNWEHLIHLISNLDIGLSIYNALLIYQKDNLWSTVAALRTIKVACEKTTIKETETLYPTLRSSFKDEFNDPIRVRLAEIILKKMEQ